VLAEVCGIGAGFRPGVYRPGAGRLETFTIRPLSQGYSRLLLPHQQYGEIAQTLLDKTLTGNITGARILLALSGANKPPEKPKKKHRSAVERLLLEPTWEEPVENEDPPDPEDPPTGIAPDSSLFNADRNKGQP